MSELNLVLLGPPGAGKGTQAERLVADFGLPYYSTGIILRNAIEQGSDLGQEAKRYVDAGELVPDEVICRVIEERFDSGEADDGFLLDGFPRTIGQAEMLERALDSRGRLLTAVLLIEVGRRRGDQAAVRPAYLREERARVPRGVRPAQERGHLRPGRLTARPARRRQARDDQEAPVRLPRADRAAHRLVRRARRCCAASTARARRTRCTAGSARRSRRCASRPSSSHDPAQDAGGARQDGRGGPDPRPLPRAAAQEGASRCHDRRARRGRRALHPLAERRARLQGLPRLSRLDLRLAQLDGRARDPGPLRAEARRHPLRSTSA